MQARTRPAPADANDLADRLRPLMLQLSRHLRREAQKSGLSPLDSQLLMAIKQSPGVGVSELALTEQMSRPTMSVHIKRLEAAGLVLRSASGADQDRRRVQLELSDKGRHALAAVRRSRTDWLATRLARMAPAELDALDAAVEPLARLVELKI